jgi:hypothetical protein
VPEGVGAADVAGVPPSWYIWICCFSSPYSFQSSTSTISCDGQPAVCEEWTGFRYPNDKTHLHQSRYLSLSARLIFSSSAAPQHAGLLVRSNVECFEWDLVGLQDGLHPRGRSDNMRRSRGQRGVQVKSGICRIRFRSRVCHSGLLLVNS